MCLDYLHLRQISEVVGRLGGGASTDGKGIKITLEGIGGYDGIADPGRRKGQLSAANCRAVLIIARLRLCQK